MFCLCLNVFFFFKQKTAYEMRISDWSSDVCSSDLFTGEDKMPSKSREDFSRLLMAPLIAAALLVAAAPANAQQNPGVFVHAADDEPTTLDPAQVEPGEGGETVILQEIGRAHVELKSLMRISYAVFCLKKKNIKQTIK